MSEPSPPAAVRFALTPRQRRLRWFTALVLIAIAAMLIFAWQSPIFRPTHPAILTPTIKKAIKVQILFVGFYWIVCFLLVALLPLLAWLDIRETVRKVSTARRDYWHEIAERSRERTRGRSGSSGTSSGHDDDSRQA